MFYSCAGSSILLLIAGCITTNFMSLLFSTFRSSSLWGIDTIIFAKLDKHPLSMKRGGGGGLVEWSLGDFILLRRV